MESSNTSKIPIVSKTIDESGIVNLSFQDDDSSEVQINNITTGDNNNVQKPSKELDSKSPIQIIIIGKDKLELETQKQQQQNDSNDNTTLQICKRFTGILFTLVSAIAFSLTFVVTKLIPNLHPITQTIWAQVVNTIISIMLIIGLHCTAAHTNNNSKKERKSIWKGMVEVVDIAGERVIGSGLKIHWKILGQVVALAIIINIGRLSKMTALNYLSIADATVMKYLSPIFVIILSHFLLREKCLIVQICSAGFIIIGAFVLSRPPFLTGATELDYNTMIGLGIKLVEALCSASYYIGMRQLRSLHFASTILIVNVTGLLLSTIVSAALGLFKTPETSTEVAYLIALGVLAAIAHNAVLLGLKFERASTVSLIRCADVPFAFLWQILIFQLFPGTWTLIGTLFVCTGVLITSISKLIKELPKKSRVRAKFGFLLK